MDYSMWVQLMHRVGQGGREVPSMIPSSVVAVVTVTCYLCTQKTGVGAVCRWGGGLSSFSAMSSWFTMRTRKSQWVCQLGSGYVSLKLGKVVRVGGHNFGEPSTERCSLIEITRLVWVSEGLLVLLRVCVSIPKFPVSSHYSPELRPTLAAAS